MSILEAIILGIIQGLTEFLPVSSSGHLELAKVIFGSEVAGKESMLFTIALHAATALSTVVVFRKDITQIIKDLFAFQWNESTRFSWYIVISMIPVFIIGMAFKDEVESLFEGNIVLVGSSLLFTALLLFFSGRYQAKAGKVNGIRAFIIGIAQAIAILPGVSRSGSTISVALISGVSREQAARFSFLMVLPVIAGAMILEMKDFMEVQPQRAIDNYSLLAGFIAAFFAGVLACRWMIKLVKRSKLDYFALYCLIVGVAAILYGVLS